MNQAKLKELLSYDRDTGIFIWKKSGKRAGSKCNKYIRIQIEGKSYYAHRLAWLYEYGSWPTNQIDHENQKHAVNTIENLRDIPQQKNARNTPKRCDNTSGTVGVRWLENRKKWIARIYVDGVYKHLGCFTKEQKAIAVRKAAEVMYGYHHNHGKNRVSVG